MHVLLYKGEDYCSVMGIFFTKKGAKKARDRLRKADYSKYPKFPHRREQTKSAYSIIKPAKGHADPFWS